MPKIQSVSRAHADGYKQATKDVESWLQDKLRDWDEVRTLTKSRTGFMIGVESALHGARRDIQRGAHHGASARAARV